ncbi:hypothetical protein ACPA9J_12495 [Pseudomonas aeruginosa]
MACWLTATAPWTAATASSGSWRSPSPIPSTSSWGRASTWPARPAPTCSATSTIRTSPRLRVLAKNGNTGNVHANLNITDTSKLNSSDFRLDFDGTNFTARRPGDDASIRSRSAVPVPTPSRSRMPTASTRAST